MAAISGSINLQESQNTAQPSKSSNNYLSIGISENISIKPSFLLLGELGGVVAGKIFGRRGLLHNKII